MDSALKYIDLFAGCGGLSVGLHLAGWEGSFAVEKNRDAFATLSYNLMGKKSHFSWPDWLEVKNWNITDLLREKARELRKLRGTVDLVVGGPPCQGFSTAGRRVEDDERNDLMHSYLEFVRLVQPRAVFFENVRGFTMRFRANRARGISYSELVIEKLRALGYEDAVGQILDLSDFGLPQRRQRFIVVGTRNGGAGDFFEALRSGMSGFLAERGIARSNGAGAALSDLHREYGTVECPDSNGFESGRVSRARSGLQRYLRLGNAKYVPDSHRFVNHTADVQTVFERLLGGAPRNRCILGREREPFGLKKRSVTVLDGSGPAPTVTTIPDDFVHYSEPRVMTVRECARLQTFPDWFEFKGPYTTGGKQRVLQTPRYTQVGNAVPPLFAEMAGLVLKQILTNA
ncbi:DNA cytosine methyltransferase [Luteolibacter arcticus]|uniref:Cytosine-specific methyltransferase n=1 Tax=Luteolibacter arcticus TaxID=1581411 RepID=A0ABT3GSR3_9BACT|nr:DNA cytosine methyltransferase [Luteolibacter arcticus]MCW1926543.1 DNA cytosine methyltransferase [Luteolibacter arcticus]